ncbi:hypothetical protein GF336_02280 [Candidatus Woesearchaeota archaeon]|nr:hypothetical protein [Candidatus Woesearchaeota archaeon]
MKKKIIKANSHYMVLKENRIEGENEYHPIGSKYSQNHIISYLINNGLNTKDDIVLSKDSSEIADILMHSDNRESRFRLASEKKIKVLSSISVEIDYTKKH